MAIYQNAERNKILLNAYGVVIDPSLFLCYDAGNPYSVSDFTLSPSTAEITTNVFDLSQTGNSAYSIHSNQPFTSVAGSGSFATYTSYLTSSVIALTRSFDQNPLSISTWFYQDTSSATFGNASNPLPYSSSIVTNAVLNGRNRGLSLDKTKQLAVGVGNVANVVTTASIAPNEWYHATLIYTATDVKLYVNSILRYSRGSAAGASTGSFIGIGGNYALGVQTQFPGYVALPMLYSRELSQAKINQNYTSQATRFGHTNQTLPPLKLYFDPGNTNSYTGSTPTKIYDLSGNRYTGSLSASNATTADRPIYSSAGGGSLYFNGVTGAGGSGSYIGGFVSGSSAIGTIDMGTVYTIDMWLNTTAAAGIWLYSALAGYHVYTNGGDNATNLAGITSLNTNMSNNIWYNLVTIRNGAVMWCYLNGLQATPAYTTGNGVELFTLTRMGSISNGYYPRGYLGAFKVYSGVLSAVQIYNNFQSTRARYGV